MMKATNPNSDKSRRASSLLKLLTGIVIFGLAGFAQADDESYIQIDCYHYKGPGNETTTNLITVSAWDYNDEQIAQQSMVPDCGRFHDEKYDFSHAGWFKEFVFDRDVEIDDTEIKYFVIQTNGSNAFWMDEVYLKEYDGDRRYRYGRDGGLGYCLSTDPNDAKGSWSDHVDRNCHSALKFYRDSLDVYGITPPKLAREPEQKWDYKVLIDCHHKKLDHEDTKDTITVEYFSGATKMGEETASSATLGDGHCNNIFDAAIVLTSPSPITEVKISTDGTNAFYMDEIRFSRTNTYGASQRKTLHHWGQENGKGWCLSQDKEDANGAWRNYLTGEDHCFKSIRFVVGSDTWYWTR